MSADGQLAPSPEAPTGNAPPPAGGSILTSNIPAPPPPPEPGTAAAQVQEIVDAPPEWAPEKFWDREKKTVRVEELGKGYKNLEQLLGREKIPMPASDDDIEGWERVYSALGRPKAPNEYEFKRPELPEDLPYDEDLEESFRSYAFANGLNRKQATAAYDFWVKRQVQSHSAWASNQKQEKDRVQADLIREYGNGYEGFLSSARSAMGQFADPDFKTYLDQSGLGNDPRMIRVFGKIGRAMNGETRLQGSPAQQMAPADIDKAINEFREKNSAALYDRAHPNHERAVAEWHNLYKMKFPDQPL